MFAAVVARVVAADLFPEAPEDSVGGRETRALAPPFFFCIALRMESACPDRRGRRRRGGDLREEETRLDGEAGTRGEGG